MQLGKKIISQIWCRAIEAGNHRDVHDFIEAGYKPGLNDLDYALTHLLAVENEQKVSQEFDKSFMQFIRWGVAETEPRLILEAVAMSVAAHHGTKEIRERSEALVKPVERAAAYILRSVASGYEEKPIRKARPPRELPPAFDLRGGQT